LLTYGSFGSPLLELRYDSQTVKAVASRDPVAW
jgi:hypothetical protein